MDQERRRFLAGGLAAGLGGFLDANNSPAVDIEKELVARLKYLSPPDGIAIDDKFGVPFPSPPAKPFQDELVLPPIAEPAIDMRGDDWKWDADGTPLCDDAWLAKFSACFRKVAERYKADRIEIGDPPDPKAHQRFFEFRPQVFYIIREVEVPQEYHRLYPGCFTWCYEILCKDRDGNKVRLATSPGPTIRARYGEPVLVRRINNLPEVGNGRGGAQVKFAMPSTTMHLHNAHTASESDGNPDDYINPGEYWDHHYGNFPSGFDEREKLTTLWYHDHRMDFTAANVYAGLNGFYMLYDEEKDEEGKCLSGDRLNDIGDEARGWQLPYGPKGKYDVPLMLHDLLFRQAPGDKSPQLAFDGFNSNGVLGDQFTVNRIVRPKMTVERRKYRFRVVNGGPSRFYQLSLHTEKDIDPDSKTSTVQPFVLVTGDGNFQPNPVVTTALFLGVAQRADFILDFSHYECGDQIYLVNRLRQIQGEGSTGELVPLPVDGAGPNAIKDFFADYSVMRFDVAGPKVPKHDDPSQIRLTYRPLPKVDLTEVVRERVWHFDHDGGLWTVNGRIYDGNRIDAGIEEHTAEIWTLRNAGNNWQHPIHSHFTEFIALEEDGRPLYQTDVQTGEFVHQGGLGRRCLIDVRDARARLGLVLKRKSPIGGLVPLLLERLKIDNARRVKEGLKPIDLRRAEPFAEDEIRAVVVGGPLDPATISVGSVDELLQWAEQIETQFDVHIRVPSFSGGPRRDIALLLPGTELKVFLRWRDFRGKYVMHCHNVVHEDHAMMVRWDITPRGEGYDTPRRVRPATGRPPGRPFAEPHPGQTTAQDETVR